MAKKITLPESEIPKQWYNINADLPSPLPPPLNPGTGEPIGPDALTPIFPMGLIEQEVSPERWIAVPEKILEVLTMWRPTPLVRADRLEEALGTPARIYFKNESVSPPGSHKPNTAVAQAYFNKKEGVKRLTTETGAGQWGSALSFACNLFGLGCTVYMVRVSYEQKPYRKSMILSWGAEIYPSPTNRTHAGRAILEADPDCPGSLGIARQRPQPRHSSPDHRRPGIEEAVRDDRGVSRHCGRLHRRREQLRRLRLPVPRRQDRRRQGSPGHRRRTDRMPHRHSRALPL
jgi:tryptophan synthase beta chain